MLFPAYLAYKTNLTFVCAAILVAMICSMIYHVDEDNPNGLLADLVGVIAVVACMFHIAMNSAVLFNYMNVLGIVYIDMAILYYNAAFDAYEDGQWEVYEFYHMAWHVLVSFSMAAFVYSYHGSSRREDGPTRLTRPVVDCEGTDNSEGTEKTRLVKKHYCSVVSAIVSATTWNVLARSADGNAVLLLRRNSLRGGRGTENEGGSRGAKLDRSGVGGEVDIKTGVGGEVGPGARPSTG